MMTSKVTQLIEEQIGRKMSRNEIAEISRLNDEGWPVSVLDPLMQVVLSLIESAREYGERKISTASNHKQEYEKGRMDEAEVALRNLYIILEQMNEAPHPSNHIVTCIRDLEKVTGKDRKYYLDEENAFS